VPSAVQAADSGEAARPVYRPAARTVSAALFDGHVPPPAPLSIVGWKPMHIV
jgi:hypothetical protein